MSDIVWRLSRPIFNFGWDLMDSRNFRIYTFTVVKHCLCECSTQRFLPYVFCLWGEVLPFTHLGLIWRVRAEWNTNVTWFQCRIYTSANLTLKFGYFSATSCIRIFFKHSINCFFMYNEDFFDISGYLTRQSKVNPFFLV